MERGRASRALVALVALAVCLGAVVGAARPAGAQADARLVIRAVDSREYPTVGIDVMAIDATPGPGDFEVSQNGVQASDLSASSLTELGAPVGTVFVIDSSEGMKEDAALDTTKVAVEEYVRNAQPNERFALVAVSGEPRVVVEFTDDIGLVLDGLDGLVAAGTSPMVDGVQVGLNLYDDRPDLQPNLVVVSGSADNGSTLSFDSVRGGVLEQAAAVFVVGIALPGFDGGSLSGLASASNGLYVQADDPDGVGPALRTFQAAIEGQYRLVYTGDPAAGRLDLLVSAGDLEASASVNPGTYTEGPGLNPQVAEKAPGAGGFLSGTAGKVIGALLALIAVTMLAYVIGRVVVSDDSSLEAVLRPYAGGFTAPDEEGDGDGSLAQTTVMKRAVDLTTKFAQKQGMLTRVERMLEKADLPLRAGEALFFYVAMVVVLTLLALVISRNLLIGLGALALFALVPPAILGYLANRRQKKFVSQLPDTLQLLSGSLRAGYSLMQGIEAVAQQVEDPMGRELRRVVVESRLGRPAEDAMEDAADRMQSPDFSWAVMAIRIQREVGGNLSELLLTVADTMVQRERLRRDVKSLTAEGRISAIVLGALPVILGIVMWVINPEYIEVLFDNRLGQLMLAGSVLLAFFGFWWMKKTIEIEV
ncbi:MAG: type II secretion system F family protein [Acidimicrobiales bacterium]|nr:type II secretion system F family protein [Acidimicrobiales bacterium]